LARAVLMQAHRARGRRRAPGPNRRAPVDCPPPCDRGVPVAAIRYTRPRCLGDDPLDGSPSPPLSSAALRDRCSAPQILLHRAADLRAGTMQQDPLVDRTDLEGVARLRRAAAREI